MSDLIVEELLDISLASLNELWQIKNTNVCQFSDDFTILEMRNVNQWALIKPLTLNYHLNQMNKVHGTVQVSFVRRYIYHTLYDSY